MARTGQFLRTMVMPTDGTAITRGRAVERSAAALGTTSVHQVDTAKATEAVGIALDTVAAVAGRHVTVAVGGDVVPVQLAAEAGIGSRLTTAADGRLTPTTTDNDPVVAICLEHGAANAYVTAMMAAGGAV